MRLSFGTARSLAFVRAPLSLHMVSNDGKQLTNKIRTIYRGPRNFVPIVLLIADSLEQFGDENILHFNIESKI